MHNFKELNIWKESLTQAKNVCIECRKFPDFERYGLTSQISRSAVSIPSNIAEGCSRKSNKDFARFLRIALGSSYELETQLLIAKELGYIKDSEMINSNNKVQRMIYNLISKVDKQ